MVDGEASAVAVSIDQLRQPSWARSVAFDDAAEDCERAATESTFAEEINDDRRQGYATACRLMAMSMRVAASRAAPDDLQRATSTPQAALAEVQEYVAEQITHIVSRIKDGLELGAAVWRIALEEVVREHRAFLAAAPSHVPNGSLGGNSVQLSDGEARG